jgi:hypothetical protein
VQVEKCPRSKDTKRRYYSGDLKEKLLHTSRKYADMAVHKATGVTRSLLCAWRKKEHLKKGVWLNAQHQPIVIKELPNTPSKVVLYLAYSRQQRSMVRLTSPNGNQLELSHCSNQDVVSIVNLFFGNSPMSIQVTLQSRIFVCPEPLDFRKYVKLIGDHSKLI